MDEKAEAEFKIALTKYYLLNSAIHKAASSLVTGRSLQNGKMSMGNHRTERPPDPVLYGGRQSGGFVNRAVKDFKTMEFGISERLKTNGSFPCWL